MRLLRSSCLRVLEGLFGLRRYWAALTELKRQFPSGGTWKVDSAGIEVTVRAFSIRRVFAADQFVSLAISSFWWAVYGSLIDLRRSSSLFGSWDLMKEFAGSEVLKPGRLERMAFPLV